MEISTKYSPQEIENKWYSYWMKQNFFHSTPKPGKKAYTIVIPPPNVTGVLHMGHMLNNTIQDVLIRRARMKGLEACWVPGTDHASIATEAKVVAMLKEKGIEKSSISREEFLKYAWEWKEKYGGIILEQLKKLGASCDWERTKFTMDEDLSDSVITVFTDLYKKGLIYRGVRMVNWDPQGKTALSDDEVIFKEVNSKLYHIRYQIEGSDEYVTIATVRPETIMADAAICIHPADERYQHLKGKKALIPLINRAIPIIEDEYVTMDFGTGCLKVTPAHDLNDYELGIKHKLPVIDILNDDGTLNEKAQIYVGVDRFIARKKIAKELEEKGHLEKAEEYKSNVGFSERTDAVIEPRLSLQWFLKMDKLTVPALENVMNDTIKLHPPKFKNMYRSWMENVRDWCISRQLLWGHRIPAWYGPRPGGKWTIGDPPPSDVKFNSPDTNSFHIEVAKTKEEAQVKFIEYYKSQNIPDNQINLWIRHINQDNDVLDTWFSSWLWPISVFDPKVFETGKPNEELKFYYPTNDLVTAPEILFFWVARMIIAGYEYLGDKPFENVYLTGIVRDKLGRKMSKSLGNSPDPLDLIANFGADAVRTGMLFSSPAGNDLLYDEKLVEQGRNFSNKIWNAFRLVKGWEVKEGRNEANATAISWFEARFNQALTELEDNYDKYRMSDALMTVYKLVWDDFCAWYLEMVKPEFGQPIDKATYEATVNFFERIVKVLHPFMPFITEEIWQSLKPRSERDCLIVAEYPQAEAYDAQLVEEAAHMFEAVSQIRNLRSAKGLSPKETLGLFVKTANKGIYERFQAILIKLANVEAPVFTQEKVEGSVSFVIKGDELSVPMAGAIDVEKERENIEKELAYTRGFLETVMKKLSNERFVSGAPAQVLENERKKQADAEAKIKALEESLQALA